MGRLLLELEKPDEEEEDAAAGVGRDGEDGYCGTVSPPCPSSPINKVIQNLRSSGMHSSPSKGSTGKHLQSNLSIVKSHGT